jgi:hypothetical protein
MTRSAVLDQLNETIRPPSDVRKAVEAGIEADRIPYRVATVDLDLPDLTRPDRHA